MKILCNNISVIISSYEKKGAGLTDSVVQRLCYARPFSDMDGLLKDIFRNRFKPFESSLFQIMDDLAYLFSNFTFFLLLDLFEKSLPPYICHTTVMSDRVYL